jgi:hypothetical protein
MSVLLRFRKAASVVRPLAVQYEFRASDDACLLLWVLSNWHTVHARMTNWLQLPGDPPLVQGGTKLSDAVSHWLRAAAASSTWPSPPAVPSPATVCGGGSPPPPSLRVSLLMRYALEEAGARILGLWTCTSTAPWLSPRRTTPCGRPISALAPPLFDRIYGPSLRLRQKLFSVSSVLSDTARVSAISLRFHLPAS